MVEHDLFNSLIVSSFRVKPIRTAVLVDNEYPCYSDYNAGDPSHLSTFKESDRAQKFYRFFKSKSITCDIYNARDSASMPSIDRIRNSDLVLLDYHLSSSPDDSSIALDIVQKLADTPHFNLVVIHTMDANLKKVWLETAVNLKGGWRRPSEIISSPDQVDHWDDYIEKSGLPDMDPDLLGHYLLKDVCGGSRMKDVARLAKTARIQTNEFALSIVHSWAVKLVRQLPGGGKQVDRCISAGHFGEGTKWILCKNVFIVITNKNEVQDNPEKVIDSLDDALVSWRPSLVRLVMSEIQNAIENASKGPLELGLNDKKTEAGLLYFAMRSHLVEFPNSNNYKGVIDVFSHHVLGGLKDSVLKGDLHSLFTNVLSCYAQRLRSDKPTSDELARFALSQTDCPGGVQPDQIIHALNAFLSSTPFDGDHLTNGTVFYALDDNRWYVCVTPSCDMVPRATKKSTWLGHLHPLKPVSIFCLEPGDSALVGRATHGRSIFINHHSGALSFKVIDDVTRAPNPRIVFVENLGQVDSCSKEFSAVCPIVAEGSNEITWMSKRFRAVAQLREDNASLLLQQAGHHLSRIGVNFLNYPDDFNSAGSDGQPGGQ